MPLDYHLNILKHLKSTKASLGYLDLFVSTQKQIQSKAERLLKSTKISHNSPKLTRVKLSPNLFSDQK